MALNISGIAVVTARPAAALRQGLATIFEWLRRVFGRVTTAARDLWGRDGRKSEETALWRLSARVFAAPKA